MSTMNKPSSTCQHISAFRNDQYVDSDDVRTTFTLAMSAMYRGEVPLYGDLIRIVKDVNNQILAPKSIGDDSSQTLSDNTPSRLDIERHGAIRLGTPYELRTIRRIFQIIGLRAVGYYDLSVAGLPMHATCFRPIDTLSLAQNPFRIFTTLLRPELLQDEKSRTTALNLLERRKIFSPKLLELLDTAEQQGHHLTPLQAESFVIETMKTFSWRPVASATEAEYKKLASEHPILADIACFKSSHINHLTPRTLDITVTQRQMIEEGLQVKDRIEGPPPRKCPILLRQTSFLAQEEAIKFLDVNGNLTERKHRARFGEVEERGAAVTVAGRELYDRLLAKAANQYRNLPQGSSPDKMDQILANVFAEYPDDWEGLRKQGLIYCKYRLADDAPLEILPADLSTEALISKGVLKAEPITYEDFLPFSAAGIFQSNLGSNSGNAVQQQSVPDLHGFELALGCPVLSADEWYQKAQQESIDKIASSMGLQQTS